MTEVTLSPVGRNKEFEVPQYTLNRSKLNLILLAARPTRGVFQVDGWGELNANVFYGALTGQLPGKNANGELVLHSLALANRNDLWYSGGGMFQPWTSPIQAEVSTDRPASPCCSM